MRIWSAVAAGVAVGAVLSYSAVRADEVDFEGLTPGQIPFELSQGAGVSGGTVGGVIRVRGLNAAFPEGTNAAVIFDSGAPTGDDPDLGTPNEAFGGPGVGAAGALTNDTPLGNILIVGEDLIDANGDGLVDDPDDAANTPIAFLFDFTKTATNGKGTVTVNSVKLMDIESEEGPEGVNIYIGRPDGTTSLLAIPPSGNNGVVEVDHIGLDGASWLGVSLVGSGAIASVVVDEGETRDCWITTGGYHNAGFQAGQKSYTFGGNVGPPPAGSWEVIDHSTGDNFHSNEVSITGCTVIPHTGPGQPGGKKGFEINRADFAGTGRLNGVDGYPFRGYVIDGGEPQGKRDNQPDEFEIEVYAPGSSEVVFYASGPLDGGNVQIHPARP